MKIEVTKKKNSVTLSGDKHSLLELVHTIIATITDDKSTELQVGDFKLIVKISGEK